jgi:hypothetical protein
MLLQGQSATSKSVVYVSTDNAQHWNPVLTGKYLYGLSNNGELIVAVESNKKTDSLLYSLNHGSTWHKFRFNKTVNVDYLFVEENSQHPNVFLIGTKKQSTRIWRISFNPKHKEEDEVTMKALKDDYDNEETFDTATPLSFSSANATTSTQAENVTQIVTEQTQVADKLGELMKLIDQEKVYIIIYVILGVILITSIVFTVLLIKLKFRLSKNAIYTSINAKSLKKKSRIFVSDVLDKLDVEKGSVISDDKELLFKTESEQF